MTAPQEPQKEIRELRIEVILMLCGYFLVLVGLLIILGLTITAQQKTEHIPSSSWLSAEDRPEIRFEGLTDAQIMIVEHMVIDNLANRYLVGQRSLLFVDEIEQYNEELTGEECKCDGFNNNNGEIVIEYTSDISRLMEVTCHELLHTYMLPTGRRDVVEDPVHLVVYDLANQGVCYEKTVGMMFG